MLDIIFIRTNHDKRDWLFDLRFRQLRQRFPFVRLVNGVDTVHAHFKAAKEANTNFFFVVDSTHAVSEDFHFDYKPHDVDKQWVTRFKTAEGDHEFGVRLFHKSAFKQEVSDKTVTNFIHNFGTLGIKDVDIIASKAAYDIPSIFLASRDLDDWSVNYQLAKLRERFPHAEVVENSDVVDLHFEIAQKAKSPYFFVLDAGFTVTDHFDLTYMPHTLQERWVTRFRTLQGDHTSGMRMFLQNAFTQKVKNKQITDFVNDFGTVGVKDVPTLAAKKKTTLPDVIFYARNVRDWSNKDRYNTLKSQWLPHLKYVENDDIVEGHFEAAKLAETEFFYVLDAEYEPNLNTFWTYKPSRADTGWVTRFNNPNDDHLTGLRLFHKSTFEQKITDKAKHDFINDFGVAGVKDVDVVGVFNHSSIKPDVILLVPDYHNNFERYKKNLEEFTPIKVARGANPIELHRNAAKASSTSFFYAVDCDHLIDSDFDFSIIPEPEDANWVRRFKSEAGYEQGVRLMHKQIAMQKPSKSADFINKFGKYGVKDDPEKAGTHAILDIIFIDSGESFADEHYKLLTQRFGSRVKRVSNVKGLWDAHAEAAKISTTAMFYVVDADAVVHPSFRPKFIPDVWNEKYVYIWSAVNELTGLSYGNGGIKLLNKQFFKERPENYVDMTTTIGHQIADGIKVMEEVSCYNRFYEDEYLAWRGAFRECAKLKSGIIKGSLGLENEERLNAWLNIQSDHVNAEFAKRGAAEGVAFVEQGGDLALVNNYDWLKGKYESQ